MNWADAYERISGALADLREAHAKTVTRNAELSAELAEANNRWLSACDVGRRLEVRNAQLLGELDEAQEALGNYTTCWHCKDVLLEEDPRHCVACPPWDCCGEEHCSADGCEERRG